MEIEKTMEKAAGTVEKVLDKVLGLPFKILDLPMRPLEHAMDKGTSQGDRIIDKIGGKLDEGAQKFSKKL